MPQVENLETLDRFIGMFVGRSGSGKTVAAASFPKPIYIMDFDGRIRGIQGAPWLNIKGIEYDYFPSEDPQLIKKINDKLDLLQTYFVVGKYDMLPKTIVLDSLTSQTYGIVRQALGMTHAGGKGRVVGDDTMLTGPEDYKIESQVTKSILSFLRSIPFKNVIVSAHITSKYGKPPGDSGKFAENIPIGEKLTITDKLGENAQIYFDHIFRFERRELNDKIHYYVKFRTDLARTSYAALPDGELEITGSNFYELMLKYTKVEMVA